MFLPAGAIEADLPTSEAFQEDTGHVVASRFSLIQRAERAINSKKTRGSICRIDAALDIWLSEKLKTRPEVEASLYRVIKECQLWLKKKLEDKGKSTATRTTQVTRLRDLAWRNLILLNPALGRMEANKDAFWSGMGRVAPNTPNKTMGGVYQHERNLYLQSGKTQTYSASRLNEVHGRLQAIPTPFDSFTEQQYEYISGVYRKTDDLSMRYHDKLARSEFLLDIDDNGLLRNQTGANYDTGRYAEIYAMDRYGNLFSTVMTQRHAQLNHSSFLAGKDVICAGCICVSKGRLDCIDTMSGHYKPTPQNLAEAIIILSMQNAITMDTLAGVIVAGMDEPEFVNAVQFARNPDAWRALPVQTKPNYKWPG